MSHQGILQPVDANVSHSPARKRARFNEFAIEEEKPPLWTLTSGDVVLHEIYDHGIGRLDCDSEDVVDDTEDTIFNKNINVGVDVSCASMTPETRGKQLSILESTLTKESRDKLSSGDWDNLLASTTTIKPTDKTNYFNLLSDEVIIQIFKWLPKSCLKDIALCCKRFNLLTYDESLWTRMDVSNKHLKPGVLGVILSKQVIVLRLARSEILGKPILPGCKAHLEDFRSRLLYLDLSMAYISKPSLVELFKKCRRLKKLSLENIPLNDEVLVALSANKDIEVINFAMCSGIYEDGLKHLLTNCRQIRELNISWTYLTAASIQFICENLPPSMDRLNFSGCKKLMHDNCVSMLVSSCPKLRELDLSDCTALTGESVRHITLLENLKFVSLSRCYLIPYKALSSLRKLANLSYLDIHGGYIEGEDLKEVQSFLSSSVQINQFKFSSVARPTVGMRRSSIWNMRVRD
ncbi:S-phase kinase-associated protein 2 [Euwallacea fornicatus]|uniref:S-phase kinase-associated protein 2 n=1 Tax=Euwallacea fornicatus TaxID=995702 RepID=UPI00338D7793